MPGVIATLQATLGIDDSDFQKGAQRTQENVNNVAKTVEELGAVVSGVSDLLKQQLAPALEEANKKVTDAQAQIKGLVTEQQSLQQQTRQLADAVVQLASKQSAQAASTTAVTDEMKKAKQATADFSQQLTTLSATAVGVGAAITASVTLPLKSLAEGAIESATRMDSLTRGLKTVTGSAAAANQELRELAEIGKAPGIGFEQAVTGAMRLQAAGVSAQTAEKAIKEFGNALASIGKGPTELAFVGDELARLSSRARVSARDIMELSRQVPQLREAMKKAFGTSDTKELEDMGVDSKVFLDQILKVMSEAERASSGAQNAFTNFQISVKQSLAKVGQDALPIIIPVLEKLGDAIEYVARIWTELPAPIKVTIGLFAGVAAGVGPLILIIGGLGFVLNQSIAAFNAVVAMRAAFVEAQAANAAAVSANTVALAANTVAEAENAAATAVNTASKTVSTASTNANMAAIGLGRTVQTEATVATTAGTTAVVAQTSALVTMSRALGVATVALASLVAGWVIGTQINDALIGSIDRQAQKTRDDTAAHMASIPYLKEAYEARKQLEELNQTIATSGNDALKNTEAYQTALRNVETLTKAYREAADYARQGFNAQQQAAAQELKDALADQQDKFEKLRQKTQDEFDKLKAPDLVAKLKVEFPDMDAEALKAQAELQKRLDAEKKITEEKKRQTDEAARQTKEFSKQIEDAQREVAILRQGGNTNLVEARKAAPEGTSEARIQQLAHLKDTIDALKKVADARTEEAKKITDLAAKMSGLQDGMSKAAEKVGILAQHAQTIARAPIAAAHGNSSGVPILPQIPGTPGNASMGEGFMPVGPLNDYKTAVATVTTAVKGLNDAHATLLTTAEKTAKALITDIGVENANKLIASTTELKTQLRELTAVDELHRVAIELTGKSYASLSAKTQGMVVANEKLRQQIKEQTDIKTLSDALAGVNIELEKCTGATSQQITAFDLLHQDYENLSPKAKQFIDAIVETKKQLDDQTKAAAESKKLWDEVAKSQEEARLKFLQSTATTEAQSIMLGFLKDKIKDLPTGVKDATTAVEKLTSSMGFAGTIMKMVAASIQAMNDQMKATADMKAFTDGLTKSLEDARVKNLEAKASTDANRIAIQLLASHIKDVPKDITSASGAIAYLQKSMGSAGEQAVKTAADIAKLNEEVAKPKFEWSQWAKDLMKGVEEANSSIAKFNEDMTSRMAAAQAKIAGTKQTDPAQAAWLDFLARNNKLVTAFGFLTGEAAKAQQKFKDTFNAEAQASAYDKLAKMLQELNEKTREQTAGLDEGKKHISDYQQVLAKLGITEQQVTGDMDAMIKQVVAQEKALSQLAQVREQLKKITDDMKSMFQSAFSDLFNKGFKGFFASIQTGFQQLLAKMASDFLASQLTKLIGSFFNAMLGAFGGSGSSLGQMSMSGGQTDLPVISGFAADGGPILGGRAYVVGERGPEIFVPGRAGSIVPNHQIGGHTLNQVFNIMTPDANSFKRSQHQIMTDAGHKVSSAISRR